MRLRKVEKAEGSEMNILKTQPIRQYLLENLYLCKSLDFHISSNPKIKIAF